MDRTPLVDPPKKAPVTFVFSLVVMVAASQTQTVLVSARETSELKIKTTTRPKQDGESNDVVATDGKLLSRPPAKGPV
jgi:hypothetical protein